MSGYRKLYTNMAAAHIRLSDYRMHKQKAVELERTVLFFLKLGPIIYFQRTVQYL